MKSVLLIAAAILFSLADANATPGKDLLQLFSRTFPNAEYVTWTEENGNYSVSFMQNENHCRIWYDKDGNLVCSLRYGQENDLPLKVLSAVKRRYADKHIDGVTELTNAQGVTYQLMLSDAKKWYVVNATSYGSLLLKYTVKKQD